MRQLPLGKDNEMVPNENFIDETLAHQLLMEACLTSLTSYPFTGGWAETEDGFINRFRQTEYLMYAVCNWGFHAKAIDSIDDASTIVQFLNGPTSNCFMPQ